MPDPHEPPVELADVDVDEQLIEDLRAGAQPPSHDHVAQHLAALRDEVNRCPIPSL
ncbi:hypothetical protein [Pseudonocardia broussonetiae]|uniref:Uncharacterized protein n=1 Tax=Pseudonocardia broussonetiae TaxID=2736640 RepID=A0A6M6JJW1_9PSEU|nr:hypothetical protein [Pseudonocardia broussonetiae]QJY46641.1 hypothetical protein HOP40_13125 [Pseudonocardia broussonetiae]